MSVCRPRSSYQPSAEHPTPQTFLTVNAVVAPTREEAGRLALPNIKQMITLRTGQPLRPQLTVAEAEAEGIAPEHRSLAGAMQRRWVIGDPAQALLVPESAIQSDQGVKYLYAVASDNKAVRLDITPGVLWQGMREVESVRGPGDGGKGRPLRPDERVIVSGVQRVRPGMIVDPKPAPAN